MLRFDTDYESDLERPTSAGRDDRVRETTCRFEATMPASPGAIAAVINGVTQVLAEREWPQDDIVAVELACREALANAVRHGCREDVTQYVRCLVTYEEPDEVELVVRDPGSGFDPAAVRDPLDAANTMNTGGRGIFLMRALMDDVQFVDGGREVRMRKRTGSR
jgi:serine/threonine-protein kinase RsbW